MTVVLTPVSHTELKDDAKIRAIIFLQSGKLPYFLLVENPLRLLFRPKSLSRVDLGSRKVAS